MENAPVAASLTHHLSDFENVSNPAREKTEVTLTSLLTETVHPTLVVTTAITLPAIPPVASSDTPSSQTVPSSIKTTASESTTVETTPAQTSPVHTTKSQVASELSRSTTELPTATPETSSTPLAMATSSSQQVNATPVLEGSTSSATSIMDSVMTSISPTADSSSMLQPYVPSFLTSSHHSLPNATPIAASSARVTSRVSGTFITSTSPVPVPTLVAGSNDTTNTASAKGNRNHHNLGAIVGGSIGAVAALAIIIMAFIFLNRRRRRAAPHTRENSRQSLIRNGNSRDSISSFNSPYPREYPQSFSYPTRTISVPPALFSPLAPTVSAQQSYLNPAISQYDVTHTVSNQDLSLDRVYLRQIIKPDILEDDYADLERSPVSPIIEISPPSRSVSNYSRLSLEGDRSNRGSDLPNYYEVVFPYGAEVGTHFSAESTLTLPDTHSSRSSNFLEKPQTHDSIRSDPFDLEISVSDVENEIPLPPPPALITRKSPF
ncbi:hypothetical protein N7478_002735 [Penicillium angulare]|uniref:uncharacterized protein n=1 Tax=Penicillium angulare TaxID=116970 RepID=UPI0025425BEC|nr:uncharacterized protein N7478_002735 [Penicillium angulare]KAJ5287049.1 hypothetical protein N7478_002735 [Penicillium angulare]